MTRETIPPYLGRPAIRAKARDHIDRARFHWREARAARRAYYPDVAFAREEKARYHLRMAYWLRAGAPSRGFAHPDVPANPLSTHTHRRSIR